jgi:putative oxidoreductase
MDTGLLIIRAVIGVTLIGHGTQKLFGWFGGHGLEATGEGFERVGFRPGRMFALVAGTAEAGGGLLLLVGFLTPLAAAVVAGTMLNAALSAHRGNGFFLQNKGWEYTFVLGGVALALAFTGPGADSLDHVLGWNPAGTAWGFVALAAALVVGLATDLYRRRTLAAMS